MTEFLNARLWRRGVLALLLMGCAGVVGAQDLDAIRQLAEQGQTGLALERLDARLADSPNDLQARFLRGLILHGRGDVEDARAVFLEIARQYPRLPGAFNNLAVIYAGQGEYEKARQALLSAIANDPDYAAVRANLGDLYTKMAADAYRQALELNPQDQAAQEKLRLLDNLFSGTPGG